MNRLFWINAAAADCGVTTVNYDFLEMLARVGDL